MFLLRYSIIFLKQLPYSTVGENNGRGDDHDVGKGAAGALDEAEDEAADVELPPPMKPIQVSLITN